jgi:hypothetical protein
VFSRCYWRCNFQIQLAWVTSLEFPRAPPITFSAVGCQVGELALKGVFSVGFSASLLGGFPHDSGPLNGR